MSTIECIAVNLVVSFDKRGWGM